MYVYVRPLVTRRSYSVKSTASVCVLLERGFVMRCTVRLQKDWSQNTPVGFFRLSVARVCLHVDDDNLCEDSQATGQRC